MPTVHILDYVAGNVRSLVNAIEKVGYSVEWIKRPEDVQHAEVRDRAHPLSALSSPGSMQWFRTAADALDTRN